MEILQILGIAFISFIIYIILTILFAKVFLKNRLRRVIGKLTQTKQPAITVFEK